MDAPDELLKARQAAGASPADVGTKRADVEFSRRLARHRLHEHPQLKRSLVHLLASKAKLPLHSIPLADVLVQPGAQQEIDAATSVAAATAALSALSVSSSVGTTMPSLSSLVPGTPAHGLAGFAVGVAHRTMAVLGGSPLGGSRGEEEQGQTPPPVYPADFLRSPQSAATLDAVRKRDQAGARKAVQAPVQVPAAQLTIVAPVVSTEAAAPVEGPATGSSPPSPASAAASAPAVPIAPGWAPGEPQYMKEAAVLETRTAKQRRVLASTVLPSMTAGLLEAAHMHEQGTFGPAGRPGPTPLQVVAARVAQAAQSADRQRPAFVSGSLDLRAASAGSAATGLGMAGAGAMRAFTR